MKILFDPMLLLLATAKDVLPVLVLLVLFQTLVLKRPIPRPGRIIFGFGLVLVGMACFLGGLDLAIFPVGRTMALQLAEGAQNGGKVTWTAYGWVYLFAFFGWEAGSMTTGVSAFISGDHLPPSSIRLA